MPCYDPPMWQDEFGNWHDGERPREWCDKMTRMLCEANRIIDDHELEYHSTMKRSKELREWWEQHQEWDRKRTKMSETEARESVRRRKC